MPKAVKGFRCPCGQILTGHYYAQLEEEEKNQAVALQSKKLIVDKVRDEDWMRVLGEDGTVKWKLTKNELLLGAIKGVQRTISSVIRKDIEDMEINDLKERIETLQLEISHPSVLKDRDKLKKVLEGAVTFWTHRPRMRLTRALEQVGVKYMSEEGKRELAQRLVTALWYGVFHFEDGFVKLVEKRYWKTHLMSLRSFHKTISGIGQKLNLGEKMGLMLVD